MQDFREIVIRNRSYRRFDESYVITRETLVELIGIARCTASAANLQPLKYVLSWDKGTNDLIFPCLTWAGYLRDWNGPAPGERPSAYIVILHDEKITSKVGCDHGIVAQTILLGAVASGLGGCIIGTIKKEPLVKEFDIPEYLKILLVIALGKPSEKVVLEDTKPGGDIKYWRDEEDVHHVPKRTLAELIIRA